MQRLNLYDIRGECALGRLAVYWLRAIRAGSESLYTARTKHRFFELQYVLGGTLDFLVGETAMTVNAGEFLLIPPGYYHEITGFSPDAHKLVFGFDLEPAADSPAARLYGAALRVATESDILRRLAELLIALPDGEQSVAAMQIRLVLDAFLAELVSLTAPAGDAPPPRLKADRRGELVEEIRAYIRERRGGGFPTVEALADAFHMSRRHLGRILRETAGMSPRQMLDEERLRWLRELLATTDHTMSEIAFITGFAGEYPMARFFKAKEGYTPGQYRKYTTK